MRVKIKVMLNKVWPWKEFKKLDAENLRLKVENLELNFTISQLVDQNNNLYRAWTQLNKEYNKYREDRR